MLDKKQIKWVDSIDLLSFQAPQLIHHWMRDVHRISTTLKSVGCDVQVEVLSEGKESVDEEAGMFFKSAPLDCWVRQIYLKDADQPLTYGRVTIPWQDYVAIQHSFDNLGNKPIGETLLYSDPQVKRDAFQYATIDACHALFHTIVNPTRIHTNRLWGRRSLFSKPNIRQAEVRERTQEHRKFLCEGDICMMVTEFYLPAILDKIR